MKKRILLVFILLFIFTGCSTKEETEKSEYIAIKSSLLDEDIKEVKEDLPLDIVVNIDRTTEEEVDYRVVFSNAKENMNDIEVMVIHNYYTEDLFPTIGFFDEKEELLVNSEKEIELKDTITTNRDLSSIDLELKIYIKYKDDNGKKKEIYYKTT